MPGRQTSLAGLRFAPKKTEAAQMPDHRKLATNGLAHLAVADVWSAIRKLRVRRAAVASLRGGRGSTTVGSGNYP